jgi:hypothetical protein
MPISLDGRQRISKSTSTSQTGRIWINKDDVSTRIPFAEKEAYLQKGYSVGMKAGRAGRVKYECLWCKKPHSGYGHQSRLMFCSTTCQQALAFNLRYERWLLGDTEGITEFSSIFLRRSITKRDGYKCAECGINEWNDKPITLEVEHRNGNSSDNGPGNLCLICPNCHSQTPTFRALNKGNGRQYRRENDRMLSQRLRVLEAV